MAFQPLSASEIIETGGAADLLPAGAYVCVVTEAHLTTSKVGKMALVVTWDVAEGEHVGHFVGAQYGHTEWVMLESNSGSPQDEERTRGFAAHKLDRISRSNSQGAVSFDAMALVSGMAVQFEAGGKIGQMPVPQLTGKYVGLVVGTVDETYKGKVQHRNEVAGWYTVEEVRAGKYADKDGMLRDIRIPAHKDKTGGAQAAAPGYSAPQPSAYQPQAYQQPQAYAATAYSAPQVADAEIPF